MSAEPPIVARVVSTEVLTPHMVRIVLESEALRDFPVAEFADHYVKLQFPPPEAPYSVPFDPVRIREEYPRELRQRQRTYTIRSADPRAGTVTIDFATHSAGIAGTWARSAKPGDLAQLIGPGGAYAPDPEADWHLLAGDEAVIPAVSVALERMPAGVPAFVVLEVEDEAEQQELSTAADLRLTWLHRNGAEHVAEPRILNVIRALELPDGQGQGFIHGEAGMVRDVRRHLLNDRGMEKDRLSATGYWKFRRTEERWREEKPEWNRQVELDTA